MIYKVLAESLYWECECCGSGTHKRVTLFEDNKKVRVWSINDQFGGPLDDDEIYANMEDAYSFAQGIQAYLSFLGKECHIEAKEY